MARTKDELFGALLASGLPYCNETWWPKKPPDLPYLVACAEGVSTRHADNLNVLRTTRYRIELYTHGRDYDVEEAVEAAFDGAGLPYSMRVVGVVDQTDVYEIQFTTTVVGS